LPSPSRRARIGLIVGVIVLIVLIASLRGLARFWINYLWFQSVGFTSVFRGVLLTKVVLALIFILIFFVLMFVNLLIADRAAPVDIDTADANDLVVRYRDVAYPHRRVIRIVTSVIFALLAGTGANREWNNWDLFRYHVSFGINDPEFHKDVGFYVFQLPFIEFLLGWAFEAVIVVLIVSLVSHYLNGGILPQASSNRSTPTVKAHISVLLGVLALIKAVDYYYERLELVLARNHVVNGATATSVHADKPAKTLLMVIAVIAAGLFLANIRQRGWILPAVAVVLWGLVSILIGDAYPAIYQALRVSPSEQTREAPYIERNILATREAYGLNKVQVDTNYQYTSTIDSGQVTGQAPTEVATQETLANVRLLDPQVQALLNTFDKYQALRSYYSFNDLDPDRYDLNGTETATITSIRELNSNVPSGFVNQHLEYTHGYGAVVAPISESGFNSDGTPNFTLKSLPAVGQPPLSETGSQVYFGEGQDTNGFVIGNSKTPELDYENNTNNQITEVTNHYSGSGGVKAGSLLRRAAFALDFGNADFVLSGQITPSSRVLFNRNIVTRVKKAAPFLKYDADPYAVVLQNQVWWIIDAYTTTDNYPYSQNANTDRVPAASGLNSTFNYVRNSVKVVVNAYTGQMYFIDMGTGDPILQVYKRAFPDLFISLDKANAEIPGIQAHFRYPEDLFDVQTNMYGRYHLTDAADFYSQAQAWTISPDPGSGELSNTNSLNPGVSITGAPLPVARLAPQYILAHLPGSPNNLSFSLITPYVPISSSTVSQNLVSFMTASSDTDDYGQLEVFETPAGETVDGPGLISNAIRSNQAISQELTLYDQKGSQVELGEVETIPIGTTLLYVQPVYVESSSNQIPTLKDVVVVYDGQAYHSNNASLDAALCQIVNNPGDGEQPFKSYCNTAAATSQLPSSATGSSGTSSSSGTSTTTTVPASTTTLPSTSATVPPPPANATVASLLGEAESAYNDAKAALQSGNLALYGTDINLSEGYVAQAQALAAKGTSKG
jgi:uncharacterized membrane protein (UPF0182 family)